VPACTCVIVVENFAFMWEPHVWSPQEVKSFWDYESRFPHNYWSRSNGKYLLRKYSSLIAGAKKICDLGCGDGGLLESLLPILGGTDTLVYAFDTSDESVLKVNDKFSHMSSFAGCFSDLNELISCSGASFDLIFCCEVIEHVYDDDLSNIMSSARSLIRPHGGRLVITTPNDEDLSASYVPNPVSNTVFHRWQHVRSWSDSTIVTMIRNEGFEPLLVEQLDIKSLTWNPLIRLYRKFSLRHPPNLFVVAELSN